MQILHDRNLHWLCVSNVGCRKSEINYYDSLYGGNIQPHVQKQIAAMQVHKESDQIKVNVKPVQQQNNTVDCGVFAIAFITHLSFGKEPSSLSLKQSSMRSHLTSCLENNAMTPFPQDEETTVTRCPKRTRVMVDIYCS